MNQEVCDGRVSTRHASVAAISAPGLRSEHQVRGEGNQNAGKEGIALFSRIAARCSMSCSMCVDDGIRMGGGIVWKAAVFVMILSFLGACGKVSCDKKGQPRRRQHSC